MHMYYLDIFLVLLLLLSVTNSLRLKFNPSDKLTKLSSEIDFKFFLLIKNCFKNEDYWPILTALSKARYYNFSQVLASTIEHFQCFLTLEIIQKPNFPVDKVLSADILANPQLAPCFNFLPDDFFWNSLKMTPLESSQYKPTDWEPAKHILFMESAYIKTNVKTNWYAWCFDSALSPDYIDSSITWKVVNFNCIRAFPEIVSSSLLVTLSPTDDLVHFNNQPRLSLLNIVNSIVYMPSYEDIYFGISQTMKIVSIATYLIVFNQSHQLYITAKDKLKSYFDNLKIYSKKFPFRSKLKRFVKNMLALVDESEPFIQVSTLLLSLLEFCKGEARGTWILNIFFIWNHFRGDNYTMITSFLDGFAEIFLDPQSFATVPDICIFLRTLNSSIAELIDDYSVTERIFSKFLFNNLSLSKEILRECPAEIPKRKRAINQVFPLRYRLEHFFKKCRYIERFDVSTITISLKNPPERTCYSVFKVVDDILDTNGIPDLQMNTKVAVRNGYLAGNFPKMLEFFFQNLLLSSSWFLNSVNPVISDDRPISLPSPTFPPHFMELIGFLMGKAVILNVKLPFLIDKRYFELPDILENIHESSSPEGITSLIRLMYPNLNLYASNRQVHRITEALDYSSYRLLQCIAPDYTIRQMSINEPAIIVNIPYNMYRIVLMGGERLRVGLNRALPSDLLTTTQLYNLIFK